MEEKELYSRLDFLTYNKFDIDQKNFLCDIANDKEITKYINNIAHDVTRSNEDNNITGYLIKDISINEYIGACVIKPSYYDLTAAPIEYAVHKKYRNTNKKYGRSILLCMTNLLFNNDTYSKIVLEIKEDNIPSIKAAINSGFEVDYSLVETFYNEGYSYIPYTKNNPHYKNKKGSVKKLN